MRPPDYVVTGDPGETSRMLCTDVAQTFGVAITRRNNAPTIAVLITAELNNVRFALGGAVPTQGAAGLGHFLYNGQSIRLSHSNSVRTFSFINAVNGADAAIQVTPEFE